MQFFFSLVLFLFFPVLGFASAGGGMPDYTAHWAGYLCLALFVLAYAFVIMEEAIHLRKSKPVIAVAGIIWILVAFVYAENGQRDEATAILRHNFLEYAEMAFFLLAAMAYINTLAERNFFEKIRVALVSRGFSYRTLFWITGGIAFFLSPIADNMTTALVMGAVVVAVGVGNPAFVAVSCINIVIAANSGGAFSPFGDITTLMVWQKGMVSFFEFFHLFVPSLVSWIVPAFLMSLSLKGGKAPAPSAEKVAVKKGAYLIALFFLLTIAATVLTHHTLHLPPFLGMMFGLGILMGYSHFLHHDEVKQWQPLATVTPGMKPAAKPFDIFISIKRVEWDTLIFFYGIILSVGGLNALGYLSGLSHFLYGDLGATAANTLIGVLSAIIDNIPVMFAVLSMNPDMSHGQWLLVTLTAGVGGSLLSIGSAAGVALMGQARGVYTFFSHLKWTWAIALGYAAAIWVHLVLNARFF